MSFAGDFVGDGVLDVPSARQRRAGNGLPRQCEHWLAMTERVGVDDSARPLRAALCRRDPCVPPQGAHLSRRCSVGDGVLQWSAAEQMPLGYDVPSARQRRAGNGLPRRCEHWLAMTERVGADDAARPLRAALRQTW